MCCGNACILPVLDSKILACFVSSKPILTLEREGECRIRGGVTDLTDLHLIGDTALRGTGAGLTSPLLRGGRAASKEIFQHIHNIKKKAEGMNKYSLPFRRLGRLPLASRRPPGYSRPGQLPADDSVRPPAAHSPPPDRRHSQPIGRHRPPAGDMPAARANRLQMHLNGPTP